MVVLPSLSVSATCRAQAGARRDEAGEGRRRFSGGSGGIGGGDAARRRGGAAASGAAVATGLLARVWGG